MYSDIGQKSNTMIFSDRPADVNALMAQAAAVMGASKSSGKLSADAPPCEGGSSPVSATDSPS